MREVLNLAYVLLVSHMDAKERERFDEDLYAPIEGWENTEAAMWEKLDRLATEG